MEIACTDEVKVYKDEGEEDEQKKSSENLTEDKVGLVIEGEGQCSRKNALNFGFLSLSDYYNSFFPFARVPGGATPTSPSPHYPGAVPGAAAAASSYAVAAAAAFSAAAVAAAATASTPPHSTSPWLSGGGRECSFWPPHSPLSNSSPLLLHSAAAAAAATHQQKNTTAFTKSPHDAWGSPTGLNCSKSSDTSFDFQLIPDQQAPRISSTSPLLSNLSNLHPSLSALLTNPFYDTALQAAAAGSPPSNATAASLRSHTSPHTAASSSIESGKVSASSSPRVAARVAAAAVAAAAAAAFVQPSQPSQSAAAFRSELLKAANLYAAHQRSSNQQGDTDYSCVQPTCSANTHQPLSTWSESGLHRANFSNAMVNTNSDYGLHQSSTNSLTASSVKDTGTYSSNAGVGNQSPTSLIYHDLSSGPKLPDHSATTGRPPPVSKSLSEPTSQHAAAVAAVHILSLAAAASTPSSPSSLTNERSIVPLNSSSPSNAFEYLSDSHSNSKHALSSWNNECLDFHPIESSNTRPCAEMLASTALTSTPSLSKPYSSGVERSAKSDLCRSSDRSSLSGASSTSAISSSSTSTLAVNSAWRLSTNPSSSSGLIAFSANSNSVASGSKRVHIKKPLNAFMLFMKDMRPMVQEECTLKESAAINQILGRRWHELPREKQAKYYELARQAKEMHHQLFPTWSARDNYAMHSRRKKKRRLAAAANASGNARTSGYFSTGGPDSVEHGSGPDAVGSDSRSQHSAAFRPTDLNGAKKCRARFGLEHQHRWCKPCRRKKKCIRALADSEFDETDTRSSSPPISRLGTKLSPPRNGSGGSTNARQSDTISAPSTASSLPMSTFSFQPHSMDLWSRYFTHTSSSNSSNISPLTSPTTITSGSQFSSAAVQKLIHPSRSSFGNPTSILDRASSPTDFKMPPCPPPRVKDKIDHSRNIMADLQHRLSKLSDPSPRPGQEKPERTNKELFFVTTATTSNSTSIATVSTISSHLTPSPSLPFPVSGCS